MKKTGVIVILTILSFHYAAAQISAGYLRLGGLGQVVTPKTRKGGDVGAVYMDTAWRKSNITLYNSDQVIPNVPTKYELRSNELELRIDGDVKILDPKLVKSMVLLGQFDQPHNFINGKDFAMNGAPYRGLLEVIFQGKISVFKQHSFYVQPSNRNEALSTGTRDEQVQRENFLLYTTGTELKKLPKRKKMLELFGDKMVQMQQYIKTNDLDTSNEAHLAKIFEHYNTL